MTNEKKQLSTFLLYLAELLDISESQYEKAKEHYEAVGKWLGEYDSSLAQYSPEIHPQGSFNLGTVVKPISDKDEYDIDLVCKLDFSKNEISQELLKKIVGARLKENETYRKMLKEGRRCWTLEYADSAHFHMDILPAIPDSNSYNFIGSGEYDILQHAILIPDKELHYWQHSNPKGYAEWFKNRMKERYIEMQKYIMEKRALASIDDVPDYAVKTTLQRSIQILKRNRDIMFQDDQDNRPISIIITTLAAESYNNEADLYDALTGIINKMPHHIEKRGMVSWISNPVNQDENFADKWQEYPEREVKFKRWLHQISIDLDTALRKENIDEISKSLLHCFGERVTREAVSKADKFQRITVSIPPKVEITNPSKPWSISDS